MVIVTGAAGYIGAEVCKSLLRSGHKVVAVDDLSTGYFNFVDERVDFHEGKAQDIDFMRFIFENNVRSEVSGVIHLAGLKFAGESVLNPLPFYSNNMASTQTILELMKEFEVENLIYSSSCSVYGNIDDNIPVVESSPLNPVSPYGRSKLFSESIIKDAFNSGSVRSISLRYFNVAGGSEGVSADLSKYNLFPNLYNALASNESFTLYGNNLNTLDGTCVRDYVDVKLLAEAHVKSLELLMQGKNLNLEYNLGSGLGYSVKEIIEAVSRVTGVSPTIHVSDPRPGDPEYVTADISNAIRDLEWNHDRSIDEIASDGWSAWSFFKDLRG
jgi:UDP-glucose 4-epimerase